MSRSVIPSPENFRGRGIPRQNLKGIFTSSLDFARDDPEQSPREVPPIFELLLVMTINPSGDEFDNDPLSASGDISGTQDYDSRSVSERATDAWEQTKDKASMARERTEVFVRENPIPVLLGALGLGIAIGLAIRYASTSPDPVEEARESVSEKAWSLLSLPFLWPLLKTVRARAEDSAEAVKEGFDRVKNVKVSRYTKPIRKRWKSWTR
jgi:hypothetical protein